MGSPNILFDLTTPADNKAVSILGRMKGTGLMTKMGNRGESMYLVRRGDGLYYLYYSPVDTSNMSRESIIGLMRSALVRPPLVVLSLCQCCMRPSPEDFMVRKDVWKKAAPDPRGILCMDCLKENYSSEGPITPDMFDMDIPLNIMRFHESEEFYFQ